MKQTINYRDSESAQILNNMQLLSVYLSVHGNIVDECNPLTLI